MGNSNTRLGIINPPPVYAILALVQPKGPAPPLPHEVELPKLIFLQYMRHSITQRLPGTGRERTTVLPHAYFSRTSLHFEAVYMEPDGPVRVRVRNESLFKGVQINDKVLESFRWYLLQDTYVVTFLSSTKHPLPPIQYTFSLVPCIPEHSTATNEARMQEEIEFQRALRPYACHVQVPDTELLPFFGAPTAPSYFTTTLEQYIEDTAPHDLLCPVGHCLTYEAVVSEGDGELYERKNLELHIAYAEINDRELYSPLTNMPMDAGFVPCNFIRRAVREHVKAATRKWEELEDALWTEKFVQNNADMPKAGDNHSREGINSDEIMRKLLQRRIQAQDCLIKFLFMLTILAALIFAVLIYTNLLNNEEDNWIDIDF